MPSGGHDEDEFIPRHSLTHSSGAARLFSEHKAKRRGEGENHSQTEMRPLRHRRNIVIVDLLKALNNTSYNKRVFIKRKPSHMAIVMQSTFLKGG